jgi:hypothetical protein
LAILHKDDDRLIVEPVTRKRARVPDLEVESWLDEF